MKINYNLLSKTAKNKRFRQIFWLYSAQIITVFSSFLIVSLLAKNLGDLQFGQFIFVQSFVILAGIFFEFGFFTSCARLLAISNDKKQDRKIVGAGIIMALFVSILFYFFIKASTLLIDPIFNTSVSFLLNKISIIACFYPFQFFILQLLEGSNRIIHLSFYYFFSRVLYLLFVLYLSIFNALTVTKTLFAFFSSNLLAIVLILISIKPIFSQTRKTINSLLKVTEKYGWHAYTGRVLSVGIHESDKMLIAYFIDTTQLGFYSLAQTISKPMIIFSQTLSVVFHKKMAKKKCVNSKALFFNFLGLLAMLIFLVIFGRSIIKYVSSFNPTHIYKLLIVLSIANLFSGMRQIYTKFFASTGQGKILRNLSLTFSLINFFGNLILIPFFNVLGAAFSKLISLLLNYVLYFKKYQQIQEK